MVSAQRQTLLDEYRAEKFPRRRRVSQLQVILAATYITRTMAGIVSMLAFGAMSPSA